MQKIYQQHAIEDRIKNRYLYTDTERYKGDKHLEDIVGDVSNFGFYHFCRKYI